MDDTEREELANKLDKDLQSFIEAKIVESAEQRKAGHGYASVADMTVDELAEELRNHPAFMTEYDPSKPMSQAMEALQAMKYESDSNDDNAESYKEDGNKNFGLKKYRWAIDNYTAGIKCKPRDRLLNAVLYTNRAAANYHIGNMRSSLTDCIIARKFLPHHYKAILRGCQCCIELKKYSDAIRWCDEGLELNSKDSKLIELRSKSVKLQREQEREKRKQLLVEKKQKEEDDKLLSSIKDRGIVLRPVGQHKPGDEATMDWLTGEQPGGARVSLDAEGALCWPVMFVYPEYGEMDFISSFNEQTWFDSFLSFTYCCELELSEFHPACLQQRCRTRHVNFVADFLNAKRPFLIQLHPTDHIEEMFGSSDNRPAWDEHNNYTPDNILVYFEDKEKETLRKVNKASSLLKILQNSRCIVYGGTPSFILLTSKSDFLKHFLNKYNLQS